MLSCAPRRRLELAAAPTPCSWSRGVALSEGRILRANPGTAKSMKGKPFSGRGCARGRVRITPVDVRLDRSESELDHPVADALQALQHERIMARNHPLLRRGQLSDAPQSPLR